MNRGNRKVIIFRDDRDRRRFFQLLIEALTEYHVKLFGGTQMGTHFHLVILTPHGNVSEFMQQLQSRFAEYSNWRHGETGHLFQGRFKGVVIENDLHLFTALWYVFSNPVASCLVARPEDWKWSTYAATAGFAAAPRYLSIEWVETLFPASSFEGSQRLLRECMNDPQPVQAYLQAVDPGTAEALRSYISERLRELPQPCSYRTLFRPPLEDLFSPGLDRDQLKSAISLAHETHGFRIAEIARHIGRHPATVSKIYCSIRNSKRLDRGLTPNSVVERNEFGV